MAFTIEDFGDLIRLLREHPRWRDELRRWVLTEELLSLPARVEALTAIVEALSEAQRRTEERLEALILEVGSLTEAQRRTEEALQGVILRVDELRGEMLEIRYRERAHAYFSKMIRRAHLLSFEELYRLIDQAVEKGVLTEEEGDELVLADAIIRGIWREDKQQVYLVVEVSWGIGMEDVERARKRAELLEKTGVRAIPVVAGRWISSHASEQAKAFGVWQVRDGMVTPPQ